MLAALLLAATVVFPQCGTAVTPPDGWTAVRVTPQRTDAALQCEIGIEPRDWNALRERSEWSIDEAAPIEIYVFPGNVTFDAAALWMGFVRDPRGFGVEGAGGAFSKATDVTVGDFRGYRADAAYVGTARRGNARFRGTKRTFVLRRGARVIGVTITGAPDRGILPEEVAEAVVRSVR